MMDTAKEQVAADPKSFTGLYYMNLLTLSMNDTSDAALDQGEKAAKSFLGIMDDSSAPPANPRPPPTSSGRRNAPTPRPSPTKALAGSP